MSSNTAPPLDDLGAMWVAIVAVEGFLSIPWSDMSEEQQRGALVLFDVLMQRVRPFLPNDANTVHIHEGLAKCTRIAEMIRRANGAPPRV